MKQCRHLLDHIGVANLLEIVTDHDRGEFRHDLDDAFRLAISDQTGDVVDEKIEIETHLVSKFHFDEPIPSGVKHRFVKYHSTVSVKSGKCLPIADTPIPRQCRNHIYLRWPQLNI